MRFKENSNYCKGKYPFCLGLENNDLEYENWYCAYCQEDEIENEYESDYHVIRKSNEIIGRVRKRQDDEINVPASKRHRIKTSFLKTKMDCIY